jgi:hypothetical protein
MKMVIGEYNKDGYIISTADGEVLYEAGANAVDSAAPGRDASLAMLRQWCIKTGKEIAAEIGAIWSGAERVEA